MSDTEDKPVVKRGRGRPPKTSTAGGAIKKAKKSPTIVVPGQKRGRGRPPGKLGKNKKVVKKGKKKSTAKTSDHSDNEEKAEESDKSDNEKEVTPMDGGEEHDGEESDE